MDKVKKKRIQKYISWVCLVALVAVLAVMPLLAGSSESSDGPTASILSAEASYQSIDTMLIGGGSLTMEDALEITIPSAVKLTKYLVSNGDTVTAGDPIAAVDRVSVMSAITQVQETLEYLSEQIAAEGEETAPEEVTAHAGGTVKEIYAQPGENVLDVMLEHGALAVLSLDGLMAVEVERQTELTAGDTVCVTFDDGTEVDGRVESNLEGVLTVTIEDDGYTAGQKVTVTMEDGDRIGTGELYIHSQWNATAYSGTVKAVKVRENKAVSAGATLMTLEDTGFTAKYQQLVNQRREYEALMLELFKMYQSETITAPGDGVISGVDDSGTYMLSSEGGWSITLLANAPNGDDETLYHNYVGMVTEVGTDGLILKINPQELAVEDYTQLSGVPTDPSAMTETVTHAVSAPVYELSEGAWTQIGVDTLAAGDILLFAGDDNGSFVWIVRISKGTQPEEPEEPSEPEEGKDPVDPSQPESDGDIRPTTPSWGQGQMGGTFPGITGGITEEETFELYGLETVTVAAVTPRDTVTLQISIDELDISKVYVGQTAMVTVEALSGENYTATVTAIGNSGTSDGGNAKFTVTLTMPCGENMLPGMTASAFFTLDTAQDVLTVPVAALHDNGAETYVYRSYDTEKDALGDPVAVTVGVSDGENAQILSGLTEGTMVYYAYYDTLKVSAVPDMGSFSSG